MLENAYNIFKLQHELSDVIKEQRAYNSYEKNARGSYLSLATIDLQNDHREIKKK